MPISASSVRDGRQRSPNAQVPLPEACHVTEEYVGPSAPAPPYDKLIDVCQVVAAMPGVCADHDGELGGARIRVQEFALQFRPGEASQQVYPSPMEGLQEVEGMVD